jgi:hypothetical protein
MMGCESELAGSDRTQAFFKRAQHFNIHWLRQSQTMNGM